jgi:hypothetical protein
MPTNVASSTQTTPADLALHTVTKPSGVVDGDLLIVCGSVDPDASSSALVGPAGWADVHSGGAGPSAAPAQAGWFRVWTKIAAVEPASWQFGAIDTSSAQFTALRVTGFTGTPRVAVVASGGTTAKLTTHLAPTVTAAAGDLLICGWQIIPQSTAATYVAQVSMTQHGTAASVSGTWLRHLVASELIAGAGATGTRTMTTSITPATYGDTTWSILVRSGGTTPAVVTSKLEIEFVPGSGTWVDVSDRCSGFSINRPRPELGEDVAPSTLTATLKNYPAVNGFCPFTPDNPGSQYYPNIERDRRIRGSAVVGSDVYVRFFGFIDRWEPDMSAGGVGQATVNVTASDVLSRYARKELLSYYGETLLSQANIDYWPFDDPTDSLTVRALSGDPTTWPGRDGLIVAPNRPPGSATLQEPSGGHLMDGEIEFSRGNDNAPAPVVLLQTRSGLLVSAICASFRLSVDPAGLTDDVMAAYDRSGNRLWRWTAALTAGNIVWTLYDDANVAKSFWDTGAPRDDAWHNWKITFNATTSFLLLTEKGGFTTFAGGFAWTYDPRTLAYLVVGGQMVPQRKGKQTNTLQGSVSSVYVEYTTGSSFTYSEFSIPGVTSDADRVAAFLNSQGADLNALTGGNFTGVDDKRQVMYTNATRNLLDRWNEHARTFGGAFYVNPAGYRVWLDSQDTHPVTVSLILDVADDLDIPSGGWQQLKNERPTRVTGVSPLGSVTIVDTASEASTSMHLDGPTVNTSAGTIEGVRSAAARLMGPTRARLSQFGVDLTIAGTDKVAAVMALRQFHRIRLTGLPTAYLGVSSLDAYSTGWSETYAGQGRVALFVFDTDPADDPAEGVIDDDEYGRVAMGDGGATVTGGTCVGNTGTGTIIVTSSSPASTTAADYPINLDWNGERIQCSAPGGATSPQTFTVTARGVAPTVARVHIAGETIDAWHAATVAL